jgi:uncharacterized protein YggE
MRRWYVPAALAGGVTVGALVMGIVALADDDHRSQPAQADRRATTVAPGTEQAGAMRTITVSGVGSVSGTPDVLTLSIGVRTRADSAGAALDEASAKAEALIATLKGAGVAEVDIATTDVSIWPQYDNQGREVIGYEASNGLSAKLRDLSKAGAVIDAAADAVGDAITLGGISFAIDDTGPLYAKARELAVAQARTQAEQLAKAAGVGLGGVVAITEGNAYVPTPYPYAGADGAAEARSVPLQPGSQQVQLTVQVVYELT